MSISTITTLQKKIEKLNDWNDSPNQRTHHRLLPSREREMRHLGDGDRRRAKESATGKGK